MRRFKLTGWAFLLAASAVMAASQAAGQSADTATARWKSNVPNNPQSAQGTTPDLQESRIKSHSNSANNVHDTTADVRVKSHSNSTNNVHDATADVRVKSHSNSTNNREAPAGVAGAPADRIKTKSNIKNDRTEAVGDPHESRTKSNVKNNGSTKGPGKDQSGEPQPH